MNHEVSRRLVPCLAMCAAGVAGAALLGLGPLDPPAGAVDENGAPVSTQPTLADLEAKIDALGASAGGPIDPRVVHVNIMPLERPQDVLDEFDEVRIYAIHLTNGLVTCRDADGNRFLELRAPAIDFGASGTSRGSASAELFGVRVPTPLDIQQKDADSASFVTIIYEPITPGGQP